MKIKIALIVASLFAAQAAIAGDVYVGVGVGQSKLKGDAVDFINDTRPGATTDFKDATGKVFLGNQINRYFGVEGSYNYLGHYGAERRTPRTFENASAQARSVGLDAVVTLPLTQKFGVLGKVGVARTRVDGHINGLQLRGHSTDPHVGLGVQYKFSDKFAVRGEVERQRVKFDDVKNNVDSANVSLVYTFGRKAAPVYTAPVVYTPAPAPVAAPAPAPEPVAEAPVTTTKKVRE